MSNLPQAPVWRKVLDLILTVAALEFAFFLFRTGAEWWQR